MSQISAAIVVVANLIVIFSKGSSCAKRINKVLSSSSSLVVGNKEVELDKKISIEFKNVNFAYNKDSKLSLENINLILQEGKTYGIIGGTGAGKTTLINLINHFYDVDSGQIYFQGKNIQEYSFENLNKNISLVSQNPVLFTGTLMSNLKFGNQNANLDLIEKSIKIAQCEDVVDSKGGLEGLINQEGKNLSGGQKQRLTIARALCKDARVVILDDASSALDFKTDFNLRKAIKDNLSDRLIIYVSQRVSSIKDCDEIIVLEKGKIVGIGNHQTLVKDCLAYQDICLSQNVEVN